jgi:N-acyl-D-aspartate/D-glutamate deacylase
VDIHRHCDAAVFRDPSFGEIELAQGITTAVMGNCGMAPVPVTDRFRDEAYRYVEPVIGPVPEGFPGRDYPSYCGELAARGLPLNLGFLAGAGAVKTAVKGFARTPFSPGELEQARSLIREALEAGALGLSFGLMYQPERFSSREELLSLARLAGSAGGILCTHIRGEGDSLLSSVEEVIGLAREAEIPLNISHFKATGLKNWGSAIFRAIERIEAARARGQPVGADFYPYTGGSTTLLSLLPPAMMEDTLAGTLSSLDTPRGKERLRREIYREEPGWDNLVLSIGWDRILVSAVNRPEHGDYLGNSLGEIARQKGAADPAEFFAELLVSEEGRAGIIVMSMAETDLEEICRLPWTVLISDSLYSGGERPHPRLAGAFPRFIREYVRERKLLSLEEGIRKMSSLPAERLGLRDRGRLAPGYFADVLVFDPARLQDQADYLHPLRRAGGMDLTLVNGVPVWQDDRWAEERSGRLVLRGSL